MTDRLEEIVARGVNEWNDRPGLSLTGTVTKHLRAAGATVPEPPKGPVTSLATLDKWRALRGAPANFGVSVDDEMRGDLDAILPDLAKDHGLLTPEEVAKRFHDGLGGMCLDADVKARLRAYLLPQLARPAPGRGV